ncbi:trypsin-like peptidase domain-containing protein [Paenibacillus sp. LHD-117]|uniref:trypsin-like peptidase domain-containing protein n=1 Tax=Paenibacillus sp. LHD-117 TaxID=3071412 RepID=UPI0027DFBE61|nr:trypsin-like peptidase domain-containing protein [Paenibacillus sp. LHD-117]MDQ6420358.1 trypsin-like peptidase domain-containing protein [Paenibacillus sp. LHD-117]
MKRSTWYKAAVCTMLAAGLLFAPLAATGSYAHAASAKTASQQSQELALWVDGKKMTLSSPIVKENGAALAPMKELLDAMGVVSALESKTGTIIVRDGGLTLSMAVGKKEAIVNGNTVVLATPAILKNGVPYVPVRFVAEQLEASVEWDSAANAIKIETWSYQGEDELGEEEGNLPDLPKLSANDIVNLYDGSVVMIMTNKAQGSGIAVGEDLILTNYHVIADAASATAYDIYSDEMKVKGVVAVNEAADLAIIRTEKPHDLMPVEVGYAFEANKGDRVVAIGSPLGLQNTVSDGLISNLSYDAGVSWIQFNAPTDHGSSGGALFNEYGQFIGITSAGYDNSLADLNFAVSAFHAAMLMDQVTDKMVKDAEFLEPIFPETLVGAPLSDIQKLLEKEFSSVATSEGVAEFTKWEAKRDSEGWLVLTANIDPLFYLYYAKQVEDELRFWTVLLGQEFHRMLPDDKIQVLISFERDYGFQPRGFAQGEVTFIGEGKWRVKHTVIDMQLKDQMYIRTRI